MKILCLHGYTQSASLFARKASGLRKTLKKAGHDLVFIDGPLKVGLNELPFQPSPDMADADMRSWWVVQEGDPRYCDMTTAFSAVKKAIDVHGPFDGLLGFSQGAGFTAILTKAFTKIAPEHPPLKFAIIYSGFKLKAPSARHWYEQPFVTPALHVMGTLDTVVSEERSMALYECWDPSKRTLLTHPGGHYTPSQRPILEAVLAFVQELVPTEQKAQKEEEIEDKEEKEDWDAFDNIGR